MGMYDHVRCAAPLPGEPPAFVREPGHQFQSKSLDCLMDDYEITADGRLVYTAPDFNGETGSVIAVPFHGDIDFYDSNVRAGGHGVYTRNGEDAESVDYRARFVGGRLQEITETGRTREPALPVADMPQWPKPTEEDIAADKARQAASLVGRTMYLLAGGYLRDDEPTTGAVQVVAESDREWCLLHADGHFSAHDRRMCDSLFDSPEAAIARRRAQWDEWRRREEEYAAKLAARLME